MSTTKSNIKITDIKLKRSVEMENEATREILSLFTTAREDILTKSPRKIMSLVLQTMQGACLATQSIEATEEDLKLKHANQYFKKLVDLFDSDEPLPMGVEIRGNTFDYMINNLNAIKSHLKNEEFASDIADRIDLFIGKCKEIWTTHIRENITK